MSFTSNQPDNTSTTTIEYELKTPFGVPVKVQEGEHKIALSGVVDYAIAHLLMQELSTGDLYLQRIRLPDATSGSVVHILVGDLPKGVTIPVSVAPG